MAYPSRNYIDALFLCQPPGIFFILSWIGRYSLYKCCDSQTGACTGILERGYNFEARSAERGVGLRGGFGMWVSPLPYEKK